MSIEEMRERYPEWRFYPVEFGWVAELAYFATNLDALAKHIDQDSCHDSRRDAGLSSS